MKKPKISIVIPIYNDEKYLKECLDSIINQTFKDFECICVDDCSTDRTAEIINDFVQKDKRFKYIKHNENLGVSYSRYTGLLQTKANWIAFIDHDDVVSSKYLEFLYKRINNDTKIDVVSCKYAFVNNKLRFMDDNIHNISFYKGKEFINEDKTGIGFYGCTIWGKILKRDILLKLNCQKYKNDFPWCWFEDVFVMYLYYLTCNRVIVIDNILYGYREHINSLIHSPYNVKYYNDRIKCDCLIIEMLQKENLHASAYELYEGVLLSYIRTAYFSLKDEKYFEIRNGLIQRFRESYNEYKQVHSNMNIYTRINTAIFYHSPLLWDKTIGFVYFELSPKFPKINKFLSTLR